MFCDNYKNHTWFTMTVSVIVVNQISLTSYISLLLVLSIFLYPLLIK